MLRQVPLTQVWPVVHCDEAVQGWQRPRLQICPPVQLLFDVQAGLCEVQLPLMQLSPLLHCDEAVQGPQWPPVHTCVEGQSGFDRQVVLPPGVRQEPFWQT